MPDVQTFEWQLQFGEDGEHHIADLLRGRGCAVHPVYQYENHDRAPVLLWRVGDRDVVAALPDLQVWKPDGEVLFVEVKRKRRWITFLPHRETGFNLRLYRQYCRIADKTRAPLVVFFLHEEQPPTGVYCAPLSVLRNNAREWDGTNEKTGHRVTEPLALFPERVLTKTDWPGVELQDTP